MPSGSSPISRATVNFDSNYAPGTIYISTAERRLYLVLGNGQALRYGIGVGRDGFRWSGTHRITAKKEWPSWTPPAQMLRRRPDLPRHMSGGIDNPLGARAMYLGSTLYRIHGSNEPETIGQAVSSGCFRMTNEDVTDLYSRVSRRHPGHRQELSCRRPGTRRGHARKRVIEAFKPCAHAPIAAASFECARSADSCTYGRSRRPWAPSRSAKSWLPCTAFADIPAIAQRQRTEKKIFTDSEIVEGFLKTAFGAEYHLAGRVDRIRKYDGPVRVFADGTRADRKAQLAKIVADIAARVQHLDIAMAASLEDANVQVKLVRDRDLQRTITTFYGSERAREIVRRSTRNACRAFARTKSSYNQAFRRDPQRRQWRLRLLRLRL